MNSETEIRDFFGVYLLVSDSDNDRYRGKCYIGYTVNPNRRIKQHNAGKEKGGAKRTSNRGPWKMVMIVHGFPNNISALRFEWAWQQPRKSRRLKSIAGIQKRLRYESNFDYNFRILLEMLRSGPWCRLPLTIRWLSNDHFREFLPEKIPPMHMSVAFGRVKIAKKTSTSPHLEFTSELCQICSQSIVDFKSERISCIDPTCRMVCHITCLAERSLKDTIGHYVPIHSECPICENTYLWGDLIRKKNGCCDLENDEANSDPLEIAEISDDDADEPE